MAESQGGVTIGLADIVAEKVLEAVEKKLGVKNLGERIEKIFGESLKDLDFEGLFDRLVKTEESINAMKEDIKWIKQHMMGKHPRD